MRPDADWLAGLSITGLSYIDLVEQPLPVLGSRIMTFIQGAPQASHSGARPQKAGQWRVTKTYGHAEGLSCCFRQWQAGQSHCRYLHGYALAFSFTFVSDTLDDRGWCIDFGSLKPLRAWLHDMFDHTTLVAQDDPELPALQALARQGIIQLRLVPAIGCEAFAALAHEWAQGFAADQTGGRVRVESVTVCEHAGNAASFQAAAG
jgi:6-pyruvoyltetrahydropterin/6-carboxytetrahydropterin synthase